MVIMGKIAAAYGIRGWVKVQPFTEYLDGLMDYPEWWVGPENGPWRKLAVEQCEVHGKILIAQLSGCPDRNMAEKLRGSLVAVPRSCLPEQDEDEYYWSDLIGLAVVNETGEMLGTVEKLLETGANDVLCVRGASGEILMPFVSAVIRQVDIGSKLIRVDWEADY